MKTAVEWLVDQLKQQGFLYDLDIEVAKEKEKEQIMQSYNDGYVNKAFDRQRNPLEYYNQTYNQNQNNQKYDGVKLKTFIRDEADFQMPEKEIEARNIIQDLKDRYEKD